MADIDRAIIEASGLFDPQWYAITYRGMIAEQESPFEHFMRVGADLLCRPNPLFDVSYYSKQADITSGGVNPLSHYIRQGSEQNLSPHPLFDSYWYRTYIPQNKRNTSYTLLGHFLHVGRYNGSNPNALFSEAYYLSAYPDVAASGCDPLYHFELWGESEGRKPAEHVTATVLETMARVHGIKTEGGSLVAKIIQQNPGVSLENLTAAAAEAEKNSLLRGRHFDDSTRRSVLLISHRLGGGVRRHVEDKIRILRSDYDVLVLTASPAEFAMWLYSSTFERTISISSLQCRVLIDILKIFEFNKIEIHHIHGFGDLLGIIEGLCSTIDLYLHDYYLLSPQPHLVGLDCKFVGDDLELHHSLLQRASIIPVDGTVRSWQRSHRWLFEKAHQVITPSNDTAQRIRKTYPWLSISVVFHEKRCLREIDCRPAQKLRHFGLEKRFKVALPGYLQEHKGLSVARAVTDLARRKGLNVDFVIVGHCDGDIDLGCNVRITGRYSESDLENILVNESPDLVWYPAQCPETWSYTLTSALRLGLPVLCSNIGAFSERIGGLEHCRTFPWDASAVEWLMCISDQLGTISRGPECQPDGIDLIKA